MKYSLRRRLLFEEIQSPARQFLEELMSIADKHTDGYDTHISIVHGNCIATMNAEIPAEDDLPNYVHIGYLEVTNAAGDPDPACYRKGYASGLLKLVVNTADKHGIELSLSAEGDPREGMPDKDELAQFYTRYGFEETDRNSTQVYMNRRPRE